VTTDELFPDLPKTKGPRRLWMEEHGIVAWRHPGIRGDNPGEWYDPPCWYVGLQEWWPGKTDGDFFFEETAHNGESRCIGSDECISNIEDALIAFAARHGLPDWRAQQ
jgi:hypothetical protein